MLPAPHVFILHQSTGNGVIIDLLGNDRIIEFIRFFERLLQLLEDGISQSVMAFLIIFFGLVEFLLRIAKLESFLGKRK